MRSSLLRFLAWRLLLAGVLVLAVSSAALVLTRLAPGDFLSGFDLTPAAAEAERQRLGLDRPFAVQYASWLGRAATFDLGESLKYRRPVRELLAERASNTALLGVAALALATVLGLPAGVFTGSRRTPASRLVAAASLVVLSTPPLVASFGFLLLAAATGWFPVGGAGRGAGLAATLHHLALPAVALALPLAAMIERLQARAVRDALTEPSVRAALARGCSQPRVVWRHALRLALPPVLSVYGVIAGTVLSGSFAVEVVMSWPGLGALTYEALVARDVYLVAGCAAAAAGFLAAGIFLADLALAAVDPRVAEEA